MVCRCVSSRHSSPRSIPSLPWSSRGTRTAPWRTAPLRQPRCGRAVGMARALASDRSAPIDLPYPERVARARVVPAGWQARPADVARDLVWCPRGSLSRERRAGSRGGQAQRRPRRRTLGTPHEGGASTPAAGPRSAVVVKLFRGHHTSAACCSERGGRGRKRAGARCARGISRSASGGTIRPRRTLEGRCWRRPPPRARC